jgi:hypothetical protein
MNDTRIRHSAPASNLADVLERVLDKGVVVAGDISISLVGVELLNIRVRLLIASVDKAMQMGINWWETDPHLTTRAHALEEENRLLRERLDRLERLLVSETTSSETHASSAQS